MAAEAIVSYTNARVTPIINPEEAFASMVHVAFAPNLTLAAGTLLGKITVGGKHKAYANGNSDGSETALPLILEYAITTDADGNVTFATDVGGKQPTAPCFTRGDFRTEHIPNLDAAGLVDIGGKIITGSLSTGHFKF